MSKPLQGYLSSDNRLTSWKGKDSGWRLHRVVGSYMVAPEYDRTEAVILTKRGKGKDSWAGGYSLGKGALFRGEIVGSAKHGGREEADMVEEAKREALSSADYWMQKDEEAREEDERAMQEESDIYDRDPSRKGRRMTDGAVINAFLDHRSAASKKLSTDGQRLHGNWMGGSTIAEWKNSKIVLHDLGSKAAQRVQKALVVAAPKNWIAAESAWAVASRRRDPSSYRRHYDRIPPGRGSDLTVDRTSKTEEERMRRNEEMLAKMRAKKKGRDPKHDTADLIRFIWRQVPSDYRTTSFDGKPGKWIMTGESYWRHGGARILDLETMGRSEILDFARKHFGYKG